MSRLVPQKAHRSRAVRLDNLSRLDGLDRLDNPDSLPRAAVAPLSRAPLSGIPLSGIPLLGIPLSRAAEPRCADALGDPLPADAAFRLDMAAPARKNGGASGRIGADAAQADAAFAREDRVASGKTFCLKDMAPCEAESQTSDKPADGSAHSAQEAGEGNDLLSGAELSLGAPDTAAKAYASVPAARGALTLKRALPVSGEASCAPSAFTPAVSVPSAFAPVPFTDVQEEEAPILSAGPRSTPACAADKSAPDISAFPAAGDAVPEADASSTDLIGSLVLAPQAGKELFAEAKPASDRHSRLSRLGRFADRQAVRVLRAGRTLGRELESGITAVRRTSHLTTSLGRYLRAAGSLMDDRYVPVLLAGALALITLCPTQSFKLNTLPLVHVGSLREDEGAGRIGFGPMVSPFRPDVLVADAGEIRSSLNPGGSEAWPAQMGIDTTTPDGVYPVKVAALRAVAQPAPGTAHAPFLHGPRGPLAGQSSRVDEVLLRERLDTASRQLEAGHVDSALSEVGRILEMPGLGESLRKSALMTVMRGQRLRVKSEGSEAAIGLRKACMDVLESSPGPAEAALALCNLAVAHGVLGEYRKSLAVLASCASRYPGLARVDAVYFRIGQAAMEHGLGDDALDAFRAVTACKPVSKHVEGAWAGMGRVLLAAGRFQEAVEAYGHLDRTFLSAHPAVILERARAIVQAQGRKASVASLRRYMHESGVLELRGQEAERVMLGMGDLFMKAGSRADAVSIWTRLETGGVTSEAYRARLRLKEGGIHDGPQSVAAITAQLSGRNATELAALYRGGAESWPGSSLAADCELKLAALAHVEGRGDEAMRLGLAFLKAHPGHPSAGAAGELVRTELRKQAETGVSSEASAAFVRRWQSMPELADACGTMEPWLRVALARGYLSLGSRNEAAAMLAPLLSGAMTDESRYALTVSFNWALESRDWKRLLDVADSVQNWPLSAGIRAQIGYGAAVAAEALERKQDAARYWKQVLANDEQPGWQRAYAAWYLGGDAEEKGEYQEARAKYALSVRLFAKESAPDSVDSRVRSEEARVRLARLEKKAGDVSQRVSRETASRRDARKVPVASGTPVAAAEGR